MHVSGTLESIYKQIHYKTLISTFEQDKNVFDCSGAGTLESVPRLHQSLQDGAKHHPLGSIG